MSRVVIIGGSGHVGTYLVPRLVEAGFDVVNVSRGEREPYRPHAAWKAVETVTLDRDAGDKAGTFATAIRDLKPDIVIDMICFRPDSARQLVEALRGQRPAFPLCGTIWVHGPSVAVPTTEAAPRRPLGEYGIQKAAIEALLLDEARRNGFPATIVHPGHIVGPGWAPLNPAGHFNPRVFTTLAKGEPLALAELRDGDCPPCPCRRCRADVHAGDRQLEQLGRRELSRRFAGGRQPARLCRGDSGLVRPQPKLTFLPWPEWKAAQTEDEATATWEHICRSPNSSIAKAQRLLGYQPRYTSLEAVYEAVGWLIEQRIVET